MQYGSLNTFPAAVAWFKVVVLKLRCTPRTADNRRLIKQVHLVLRYYCTVLPQGTAQGEPMSITTK